MINTLSSSSIPSLVTVSSASHLHFRWEIVEDTLLHCKTIAMVQIVPTSLKIVLLRSLH